MTGSTQFITIAAILLAFAIAALAIRLARRLLHRLLDRLEVVDSENRAAIRDRAHRLVNTLGLLAYGVAAIGGVSLALTRFGIHDARWDPRVLATWTATHGINVLIVLLGAFVVVRGADLVIEHLMFTLSARQAATDLEWQRRATTLGSILRRLVSTTIGFMAILMLLRELSIDVLPILTGAGIAGLAIGFGAQNLVRDVISGFFLILEDQVRIGDLARINGVGGTVEHISLRTITLRDGEGAVQVFPNGTIASLANLSKQYAFAVVDMKVAYHENLDRVVGTMREVGASMERDPLWGPQVLEPLIIVGVESLEAGMATIRVKFKTLPLNQSKVGNELRRRLMGAFVGRGIKPYA